VLLPVCADDLCIIVLLLISVCPLEQHHHVRPRLQLATLTVQHRPTGQHMEPSKRQHSSAWLVLNDLQDALAPQPNTPHQSQTCCRTAQGAQHTPAQLRVFNGGPSVQRIVHWHTPN
jgi:hypothetical protein